ncbi:MAG: recombination mediator RecR [Armatimonadota bacterium]
MNILAEPIRKLVNELVKLPGIGPKTAQRLALYMVKTSPHDCEELAYSIISLKSKIKQCGQCFSFTDKDICDICSEDSRAKEMLCVVAEPQDMFVVEKCKEHKGLYHVLGGLISPMDGIGPDQLKVKELLARIEKENIKEVIIAVNSNVQGEATAMYLGRIIKPMGVKVTRLASGIPMGADIEYADEYTIARAFEGRREC